MAKSPPLADLERELIAFALARYGGHMSRVARALGIGRSTLYRKLREYGLDEDFAEPSRLKWPETRGSRCPKATGAASQKGEDCAG